MTVEISGTCRRVQQIEGGWCALYDCPDAGVTIAIEKTSWWFPKEATFVCGSDEQVEGEVEAL